MEEGGRKSKIETETDRARKGGRERERERERGSFSEAGSLAALREIESLLEGRAEDAPVLHDTAQVTRETGAPRSVSSRGEREREARPAPRSVSSRQRPAPCPVASAPLRV